MKEFIDKLMSELKEEHEGFINRYGIVGGNVPASIVKRCMNIVNSLAEEYKGKYVNIGAFKQVRWERDIAIEQLHELGYELGQKIDKVSEMPTGWIPCSERLPSERDWYLAVFQENDSDFILVPRVADYIGEHTPFTTEEGWLIIDLGDDMNNYYKKLKCLAWMPLPAPYTEGE